MKNQYFGDVNDYKKYGLLRTITGYGALSVAVCWMLTPDDKGPDGRLTGYLSQPARWRHYDEPLYNHLVQAVTVRRRRDVRYAAKKGLLPGARYYQRLLPDDGDGRERYWDGFWQVAQGCPLVFFDPDNGLEVPSRPYGRKNASKYLYWRELDDTLKRGHSALIYQHFPREPRDAFIERIARESYRRTPTSVVHSFRTSHVVLLLLSLAHHLPLYAARVAQVECKWPGQIAVNEHRPV